MPIVRTPRDFGALIRHHRQARGLTQQALAQEIGTSRLWVNQVERGKPRAELALVLRAIAALDVHLIAEEQPGDPGLAVIDAVIDRARSGES